MVMKNWLPAGTPAEFREPAYACGGSLIPDGEPLPRRRFVLRWSTCPEGTTYDIRVTTEDLEPIARALALDRPEFIVPESALASVPGGGRILWQVTAHLPGGGVSESRSNVTDVR
jgi:hypothetical protein